jgi:hypothetical protein
MSEAERAWLAPGATTMELRPVALFHPDEGDAGGAERVARTRATSTSGIGEAGS